MICGKCGNELPDGAKFCGKCGASQNVTETAPEVNASSVQNGKPVYVQREEFQGNAETPKKNKKISVIAGIVAVVVIIAVIAFVSSLNKFSVETVKSGSLIYFGDDVTIGEAFSKSFHREKWEYDEEDGSNEKYVFFKGYCYAEDGDKIKVKISFIYDSDVHEKDEFEIFSIKLEDEYGNEANLYTEEEVSGFLQQFHYRQMNKDMI